MPQSRLHYAITAIHLQHQTMQVGHEIFFNFWEMRRHDATQQQTAEPWRRVDRQDEMPE